MAVKILFVCTGNTCRSPMAEAIAKSIAWSGIEVSSAGIHALEGDKASEQAIAVMAEKGIDLSKHRAERIKAEMLAEADYIFTMTNFQAEFLAQSYPQFAAKISSLGAWTKSNKDIHDPFGGTLEQYHNCAEQLEELILKTFKHFKGG